MMLPTGMRIAFKTISAIVAGIFLFQQVAWAGDLINTALEQQYKDQSQTFAPSYLQNQQSAAESMVSQKQSIENAINTQNLMKPTNTQPPPEIKLDLKGPRGGSGGDATVKTASSQTLLQEATSSPQQGETVVTTQAGDIITYKNSAIYSIQTKDGVVLQDITIDENNKLVNAQIFPPDGTRQTVSNGKITQIVRTDSTVLNYNDDGTISSITYPGRPAISCSYIRDEQNNIVETILTDYEKTSHYDSNNRLTKIEFSTGETIEYDSGVISKVTKPGQGQFVFVVTNNLDSTFTSNLSQYTAADGTIYRYNVNDNAVTSVTVEKNGVVATYDKDGVLISVTKDGQAITSDTITQAQDDYNTAVAVYQQKQQETQDYQNLLNVANADLAEKTAAKDAALVNLNTAIQSLNEAQTAKDTQQTTYDTAYNNYIVAQSAYDAANTAFNDAKAIEAQAGQDLAAAQNILAEKEAALNETIQDIVAVVANLNSQIDACEANLAQAQANLTQALSDKEVAQSEYNNAQTDLNAKQIAYNNAISDRQAKETALNTASANLTAAEQAKSSAENALSDSSYAVSSYTYSPTLTVLNQSETFINDNFSSYNSALWYKPADTLVTIGGGIAVLKGTGSNYNATFYTNQSYDRVDEPILTTAFKVSSTSGRFIAALDGYTSSGAYRRIGIYVYGGRIYAQTVTKSGRSTTTSNVATLVSTAKANTTYNLEFDVTSQNIKMYIWEATAPKPVNPSYIYTVTDWTAVRPYFSTYSGTATVYATTMKSPAYASTYNSSSQLIQDTYSDGSFSTYSYSPDKITVSNYQQYLSQPYDLSTANLWYKASGAPVTISNGVATLNGTGSNYNATFYSNQTFARANNVLVRSSFQVTSTSSQFIDALDGYTSSGIYRRVGIIVQSGRIYVQTMSGSSTSLPATLISTAKANTNYTVEFQATGQNILIYLWESSGTRPTNPSYTYAVTDWATVRPYFSTYSGTATVSNMYINYFPITRTISSSSSEYTKILARNQVVQNLNTAIANLNTAQTAYDSANTALADARTLESQALQNLTTAQDTLSIKQINLNNKIAAAQVIQTTIDNLNSEMANYQSQLSQAQTDLDIALSGDSPAQVEYRNALAVVNEKQAAYDSALQARQVKEAAFNVAASVLTDKTSLKDQANIDLQAAVQVLTGAQAAKDESQAAYDSAVADYTSSQNAYSQALTNFNNAQNSEDAAKTQADSLLATLNTLLAISSMFPSLDTVLKDANYALNIASVFYGIERKIQQAYQMDGVASDILLSMLSGYDLIDLLNTSITDLAGKSLDFILPKAVLDSLAAIISVSTSIPSLTNQSGLTVDYTYDGVQKSQTFELVEGQNIDLSLPVETDSYGNTIQFVLPTIRLDTIPPEAGLLSYAYVYDPNYQLSYRVRDVSPGMVVTYPTITENLTLTRGLNTITREVSDEIGNTRLQTWNIYLDQNAERGLSYDYNAVGNLIRQTTFNGKDILYAYDANNRLSSVTYPEYPSVNIGYDSTGNVDSLTDSHGNTDYAYDIAGRLSSVALPNGQSINYTYDAAGRMTKVIYAGKIVNYAYDDAGRLTSVIDGTDTTTYGYNAAGDLISTILPNGVHSTYAYDGAGNLTDVHHEKDGALIVDYTYTLNASGDRTRMVETTPASTRTVDYTYDDFKRLTKEVDSSIGTTKYTYDTAGNRLSKEFTPVNPNNVTTPKKFTQYTYSTDNRLISLTEKTYIYLGGWFGWFPLPFFGDRTETFTYDAAGNLRQHITPDKVYYYEFDSRNLLVRYNDGQNEVTYDYDVAGNRISKTVNGVKTNYLVDPTSSIPQVLAEMDTSGNVTKTYTFGLDRIDSAANGAAQYYLQDGLGSSVALLNSDGVNVEGAISETYRYDAFGNPYFQNASQSFLYTGEQRDAETGLIYLRSRYYDPSLGRFISRDPAFVGRQSETQSLNPFIYVQNNPVNYVDPLGLISIDDIVRRIPHPSYGNFGGYNKDAADPANRFKNGIDALDDLFKTHDIAMHSANELRDHLIADFQLFTSLKALDTRNLSFYGKAYAAGATSVFNFISKMETGVWLLESGATAILNGIDNAVTSFGNNLVDALTGFENSLSDDKYIFGNGPGGGGDSYGDLFSDNYFSNYFGSSPFDLGGVYMDKALSITGQNIKDIHGVSYDPLTGQIILLSNTGTTVPEIPVDYFLAALKAVFGNQQMAPGVSIDPATDGSGNPDFTQDQIVRFLGGIENTALGKAVYDADLLMKLIGIGSDNITGTSIRPNGENISESYVAQNIPGFKDLFTLSEEVTDPALLSGSRNLRFWFVPNDMKLVKSANGDAFVFDNTSVKLMTETSFISEGSPEVIPDDPRAAAYAQFFNNHFAELAALYPEFAELEKGMRAVGLAKFIKDNNIPIDLDWISKASLPQVTTPTTTPVASATRTITVNGTGQQVELTMQGGVDYSLFEGKNFHYLLDTSSQASGLHDAAQASRSSDTTQTWSVTMNGTTYQASAFSLAPTKKDGNFSYGGTDLAYTTAGGAPLIWQRYYDSFEAGSKKDMGNGWDYMPYILHFPVAKETEQFTQNGNTSTIDVYPKIYLSDRAGGGYILFEPMGIGTDGRVFYSSEDQRIGSQVLFLNTDGSYTLVRGGNKVNFATDGRLTTLEDKNQNTIEYVYDASKKLIRIDDKSSSNSISVTYDAQGRISKVTGSDNRSVSYTYDTVKNDLTKVTQDWSGRFIDLTYDSDHRLTSAVDDTSRNLFSNTYDLLGRLTNQTTFIGTQVNSNSNLLTQSTQYSNLTSGANSGFTYDNMFRVSTATDALGNQTQYQYVGNSYNVQSVTNALGNDVSYEYDALGNITSMTDSSGNKTKIYYQTNDLGMSRPVYVEKPNGYGTVYEYDASGNVTGVIEGCRIQSVNPDGSLIITPTNLKTTYIYDSKGRISQVKDANNHITTYSYDNAGNVIQVKDGLNNAQNIEYATRNGVVTNLVSKVTDALGRVVTYAYDAVRDLVTSVTTALGTTQYSYDSRGRQTEVIDAQGHKTQFVYNDKDQLTQTIEAGNLATTADDIISNFVYNALGQLASIAGPLGAVTQFVYDLAGNVIKTLISEGTKNYDVSARNIKVYDIGEDTANITFDVDSNINEVQVFYKKEADTTYQAFTISNVAAGNNQVTLQGLAANTNYDFELQFKDNEGDISYSRKYEFKTKIPELPAILNTTIQTVTDATASIKINVSKDIQSAQITYHVRGETVDKVVFTQAVTGAFTDGLVFNLENLRSGQDYDAEIIITDRFDVTSEAMPVSFRTTGELSGNDTAIPATDRFGQIVATLTGQAYISIENDNLSNPFSEQYDLTVRDSGGNVVNVTAQFGTSSLLDRVIVVSGLASNSQYTYTLSVTSRGDITPVSGSFRTAPGGDTTAPGTSLIQTSVKDPFSVVFGIKPNEVLKTLLFTVTDQITQVVKKFYFFDIAANVIKLFLLDGLDAARQYAIKCYMIDNSGNVGGGFTINTRTSAIDETPPAIIQNTLVEKTDTTIKLHLETNELLKKLRIRYRVVGTTEWTEQTQIPTTLAFDVNISGLLLGQAYEYQYILDDNSNNELITEWTKI